MRKIMSAVLLVALGLSLMGCETMKGMLGQKEEKQLPITEPGALEMFEPIHNSAKAPCDMQKAVAKHNSVYDTAKQRKLVSYKAPCTTVEEKKKPVAKAAPKTS